MQKHSFMFSFPLWHWEFACLMRLNCQQGWKVGTKWHWSNAPTKKKKKKTWSSFFFPILCLFYFPRLFFIFFCRNEVSSFFFSSRLDVKDSFFPISLQKKLIIFLVRKKRYLKSAPYHQRDQISVCLIVTLGEIKCAHVPWRNVFLKLISHWPPVECLHPISMWVVYNSRLPFAFWII